MWNNWKTGATDNPTPNQTTYTHQTQTQTQTPSHWLVAEINVLLGYFVHILNPNGETDQQNNNFVSLTQLQLPISATNSWETEHQNESNLKANSASSQIHYLLIPVLHCHSKGRKREPHNRKCSEGLSCKCPHAIWHYWNNTQSNLHTYHSCCRAMQHSCAKRKWTKRSFKCFLKEQNRRFLICDSFNFHFKSVETNQKLRFGIWILLWITMERVGSNLLILWHS